MSIRATLLAAAILTTTLPALTQTIPNTLSKKEAGRVAHI
jgi:hypothetical protein